MIKRNGLLLGVFTVLIIKMFSSKLMAQTVIDSIMLPTSISQNGGWAYEKYTISSIFITKNHEIFIEESRVVYWDDILPKTFELLSKNGVDQMINSKVIFHCDKRVKYRFLDKIKQEVARVERKFFFYKTSDKNDSFFEADRVQGTILDTWKGPIPDKENESTFWTIVDQTIPIDFDNIKEIPNKQILDTFPQNLYSGNVIESKRILDLFNHAVITLLPDRKFLYRDKVYEMDEFDILTELVVDGWILLYRFDFDLSYEDYLYFLVIKNQILRERKNNIEGFGSIVEISFGLENKLQELGFDIID